jgi:beta-glucosidase-like glycosyl hydrolase
MSDGPSAINRMDLVSIFPAGLTAAASWDKDLIYQRYFALSEEYRDKGSHVALGYVFNFYSDLPLRQLQSCGRTSWTAPSGRTQLGRLLSRPVP